MTSHAASSNPYDQLEAAFAELGRQGVLARANFTCCQNCGMHEIDEERTPREDAAEGEYPFVEDAFTFFHSQDAEDLAHGYDGFYLSYGVFPGSHRLGSDDPTDEDWSAANAAAGRQVAETLQRHGLGVDWDGDVRTRILVKGDFSSFPYPWELPEEDESDGYEDSFVPDYRESDDGQTSYIPANNDVAAYILLSAPFQSIDELMHRAGLPEADGSHPTQTWISNSSGVSLRLRLIERITDPQLLTDAAAVGDVPLPTVESHQAAVEVYVTGSTDPQTQAVDQVGLISLLLELPSAVAFWFPYQADAGPDLDPEDYCLASTRTVTQPGGTELLQTWGLRRFTGGELVVQVPGDDEIGPEHWEEVMTTLVDILSEMDSLVVEDEEDDVQLDGEPLGLHSVGDVGGVPSFGFNVPLMLRIMKEALHEDDES